MFFTVPIFSLFILAALIASSQHPLLDQADECNELKFEEVVQPNPAVQNKKIFGPLLFQPYLHPLKCFSLIWSAKKPPRLDIFVMLEYTVAIDFVFATG